MQKELTVKQLAEIETLLIAQGYAVMENLIPVSLCRSLADNARKLLSDGQLKHAQIGKSQDKALNTSIRGDATCWLENNSNNPSEQAYLRIIAELSHHLNQTLFLGLFDFECHYALYPIGQRYQKHLDQFRGDDLRQITCILYMNEDWQTEDGGQLRLYLDAENDKTFIDIKPDAGTIVIFLSERFYHEVLPAQRERISLTGWLKRRPRTAI